MAINYVIFGNSTDRRRPDLMWWLTRPLAFIGPLLCTLPVIYLFGRKWVDPPGPVVRGDQGAIGELIGVDPPAADRIGESSQQKSASDRSPIGSQPVVVVAAVVGGVGVGTTNSCVDRVDDAVRPRRVGGDDRGAVDRLGDRIDARSSHRPASSTRTARCR